MKQPLKKYILIITSIYFVWLVGIPLLFTHIVPVVCENLTYNSEYNITAENPRLFLNIIPTAYLKANGIKIVSKDGEESFYIKDFKLKIRLLPLLSGKIHINEIQAFDININTKITPNKKLNKDFFSKLLNTRAVCDSVKIDKFTAALGADKNNGILYKGNNIYYVKNGRYLKLNMKSTVQMQDKHSVINVKLVLPKNNDIKKSDIDIELSDLNIEPLANFFRNYLPEDMQYAGGIIDLKANKKHLKARLQNCKYLMKDEAKSVILPSVLTLTSDLSITSKDIFISDAKIKSENIDTGLSGKISHYLDKTALETDINVQINKSRTEDFINMLPPFKTLDIDAYKLKKYKFFGDVIGNLSIKGDTKEPSVTGSIYISNGILTRPIPEAKGTTIKLDFNGRYLNYDAVVPASKTEKVMVKGGVELYNIKYADMRIWSSERVNLALAEEKLIPIHEILNFVIGPVPIMNIKGLGNIDIIVKGNRSNPHIWGYVNFYDVTTFFKDMPDFILKNGTAILKFDDEEATFNLKSGTVNNKKINIDGKCSLNGKFDFDVKSDNQNLAYLYKALKTSKIVDDIKAMLPQIDAISGLANLNMKVYGNIKYIEDMKFNKNFFTKGRLELLGNTLSAQGIEIHSAGGTLDFNNTEANADINALIGNSPLNVKASVSGNLADADILIPRLNLNDIIKSNDKLQKNITNIIVEVKAKYKGRTDKIEYDKIDFYSKILEVAKNNKLKMSNGVITLKNGKLLIKDINGTFSDASNSSFKINLQANNITEKPVFNGRVYLKDFELPLINVFGEYSLIPEDIRKLISSVRFDKGKVNIDADIRNNNINTSANIGGISLTYTPLNLPLQIVNGSIYVRRNYLGLDKINLMADDLPVLIDGGVHNIFSKQNFDIYINSKPKQDFIDRYFNNSHIYPLKIKGDIIYKARLKGVKEDFHIDSEANMNKDSSIYYMGAAIGDVENEIILNLDMNVIKQNILKIREFSYDKLIASQNKRKTRLNMLKVSGGVNAAQKDLVFDNLRIKTSNPTDARIFNIIFGKPNIKQGQFTSDLRLNGKMSNPDILGTFRIVEADIPFLDTTMKTLSFVFKDKTIEMSSAGEVLGNNIKIKGILKNKLTPPYYVENAELYTKIIDLDYVINKLNTAQVENSNAFNSLGEVSSNDIIIKNIKLNANEINFRNLIAKNVQVKASIDEKNVFRINDFKFNIANGYLYGDFLYNIPNNRTSLNMNAEKIDANDLSVALFDLKNQIYGNLTGTVKLNCNGANFNACMKTMNGNVTFDVADGKMPKLGSLEYLLKAGNLVKSGITGLSVNNVISILSPLKTGDFSDIKGYVNIKNGIAEDVNIATKGKDLNLYITGKYNLSTANADMIVLGLLSKKISTMLGPVGNMSLNTLFNHIPGVDLSKDSKIVDKINKIPGIELSGDAVRRFIAVINGNINGDNYVSSFKWIK